MSKYIRRMSKYIRRSELRMFQKPFMHNSEKPGNGMSFVIEHYMPTAFSCNNGYIRVDVWQSDEVLSDLPVKYCIIERRYKKRWDVDIAKIVHRVAVSDIRSARFVTQ